MAICHFLFYCILLLISCHYSDRPYVDGARVPPENHHHVIEMKSLLPASTCSASPRGPKRQPQGIQLTHRYGPCSPLYQQDSSPTSHQMLVADQSRVGSINARMLSNMYHPMGEYGEDTRLPISFNPIGAGNLVVTVGFGTPKRDFALIFDTGSTITWMQCKPCSVSCYSQQDAIFDPSASSSYSKAPCNTSCDYFMPYGDKSYSKGYYIRDTLTLTPTDVFPNFIFGCGQNNSAGFGKAAGILGMGHDGDAVSLISQTYGRFALVFCYCVPAKESSTGHLLFGMRALETCSPENSTPLQNYRNMPSFYFVNLIGITIDNHRLDTSSMRTVIDSGTVISRLPSSLYSSLKTAFQQSMSNYPSAPPASELLDTCYNLEGYENVRIPKMVLQFEKSTNVALDPSAIISTENDSLVCLAFAENKGVLMSDSIIIGNHQQKTLNILYDVQEKKVAFSNGGC